MTRLLLTVSLAALAFAAPAFAQDNAPQTDDLIVVTAARAPARASTLPADIDVIDVAAARDRGDLTLDAALADVPGLEIVRSGPVGQQASIFAGGANSQHTLVLYDGVRINDPAAPAAGFDAGQDLLAGLDRIEIVQGPMSALYGSDAIGGVVNMIPRHGGEGALNARLAITGGTFETLTAEAGLDGTLGALRYAITLEGYDSEGYDLVPERMSTRTGDPDGASMTNVVGVFDLALSDAFALDLLLRHREAQSDFDAFAFDFSTFQEFRVDDPDLEISKNELDIARLGGTWTLSDAFSLRASGGVVATDRAQSDGGVETDTFEGERTFADLTGTLTLGAVDAVFGVTAETEEIDAVQFGSPVDADQDHSGAFAAATAHVGIVDLTGAVRIDDYDGFGTQTTWRAGANVHVLANVRIYGAYGVSFRAPTLYERFVSFGNPLLDPEEGESWEIGADAKFSAFGQSDGLELRALYRSTDLSDMIDFGPLFSYVNIDKADLESAEARVTVRPLEWLTARLGYVHTDATDAATGARLLRRPENTWRAALEADWGAFDARLAWRQVGERDDILYGDDGVFLGTGVAPSYDLVRASAGWQATDTVRLTIAIDNLLDETYEAANAFAGPPRSVMLGIKLTP